MKTLMKTICASAMVASAMACGAANGAAEFNLKEEIDGGTSATDGGSSIADAGGTVADAGNTTPDEKWCYRDADGDTFGDLLTKVEAPVGTACPVGHLERDGDCNDADPSVNPGQPESTGNGKDDDCNTFTLDSSSPNPTPGSVTDGWRYTAPAGFIKSWRVNTCPDRACTSPGTTFEGTSTTSSNIWDFTQTVARGTGGGTRYWRVIVFIANSATDSVTSWSCLGNGNVNGTFTERGVVGSELFEQRTVSNTLGGCENVLGFRDR